MRKYLMVAVVTALVTSGAVIFGMRSSSQLAHLANVSSATQITNDLANNQDFISSVQSKINDGGGGAASSSTQKGDKGDTGANGLSGSAGKSGGNGSSGIDGNNGASGANGSGGANGSVGDNGLDGSTGLAGQVGAKGATGATGPAGATGPQGSKGDTGNQGAQGAQGIQGSTGPAGATGATGAQGIQGATGATGSAGATGADGVPGVVAVTATGLTYSSINQTISATAGYLIPTTTAQTTWNTAYGWGNHAAAGYALQSGKAGGQQLAGGTAANETLTLVGNSATSGNTGSNASVMIKVGNSGSTTAVTILNSGNVGIGTVTPASKLTLAGDIAVTTTGTDAIKPFQFVQVTGLGDNASVTTFNAATYSIADWNAAVVGYQTGGSCGTNWSSTTNLTGLKYWWVNNGGNWQLTVDMSGPNDGCNAVQVMFTRKEFSARSNYGF